MQHVWVEKQLVKLHSPADSDTAVEIGRTEIISNSLNPKFVTLVPVVSAANGAPATRGLVLLLSRAFLSFCVLLSQAERSIVTQVKMLFFRQQSMLQFNGMCLLSNVSFERFFQAE